jgi:uncharacterized repeat protein (TIGR03803 family)
VFKVNPSGVQTVLHSFQGGTDGGTPKAGVIRDSAGNLYGTTFSGGATGATGGIGGAGCGVVFKVSATGRETVLHTFAGGTDGCNPFAGVVRDSAGNLYGTTSYGGASVGTGAGVVFKVTATGQETVLYSFTGGADGAYPVGGVIFDSAGNLYGTTSNDGRQVKKRRCTVSLAGPMVAALTQV